jgi:ferric-dicitrate binding protein FerR (iron transport regulator)
MRVLSWFLLAALMVLPTTGALADDWTAVRLRGVVLEFVHGDWQRLERGDVIPDSRSIRTANGRVTLVRGAETVELGPNTQIQIFDRGGRRPFTTVREHFGSVSVEAEVRDVQHFAVQTPYLVAVVKGTRFVVRSGRAGSGVKVMRGAVEVHDGHRGTTAIVRAGQSAGVGAQSGLKVTGVAKKSSVAAAKPAKNEKDEKAEKAEKAEKPEKPEKPEESASDNSGKGKGSEKKD